MANQNNPANPVPGGQNRNRPNPPQQPKLELKLNPDSYIHNGVFFLNVDVRAFLGTKPIINKEVFLKEKGPSILDHQNLDDNGETTLRARQALEEKEQTLTLRVYIPGIQGEEIVTVVVPSSLTAQDSAPKKPAKDKDPEIMTIRRYHDGNGKFSLFVRVLKRLGVGLSLPVTIWYRGEAHKIKTDKNGEAVFEVPSILMPGDSEEVVGFVSGIEEASKIKLHYHKFNQCPFKKYTADWFFKTNNGRAMILAYTFLLSLILALTFSGLGSGFLNKQTFRGESGLSKQESIYNRTIGVMAPTAEIQPVDKVAESNLAAGFWKLTLILFGVLVIYGPLAWREEIKEAVVEMAESISDRAESKSHDPMWENLAKMIGSFAVARRSANTKISITDTTDQANPAPPASGKNEHHGWMQIFQISMLGDLAFELLPKLLRKIFMK